MRDYLLGVKIRGLVPLRVLKSKMATIRVIPVPVSPGQGGGIETPYKWFA